MLTSSRLYAKEFTFDKLSCIKQTIYQKLRNSNGYFFSFTPQVFSISPLDCYFRRLEFSNKIRERKQPQEHQHFSPILLEFCHCSPSLCKNHKKMRLIRKSSMRDTLTEAFVFSSCRCSKQSEHFIRCGCFQICSGNNNT